MYGVIDFYKACKKEGIHPVIGCEVYVAPRRRFDMVHELDSKARHLILLCKNETGYRNLSHMVSKAYTEGFYIRPRIDLDLLHSYAEGLICLSACLAGELSRRLCSGDYEGAKQHALEMDQLFGRGNYYLELQNHHLRDDPTVIAGLLRIHEETGIPLVATNDAHYLRREDARAQDILMCIQTGKTEADPNRMKFENDEMYIKSEEEMAELFPNCLEALENTQKIADMCQVTFEFGKYHLPEFHLPEGEGDIDTYFEKVCRQGFDQRYPGRPPEYQKQLEFEMDVIRKMGFVEYFLIVSDFVNYAKSQDIPVGLGRGSAVGSIVAYSMGITGIDPMRYDLNFERFLNPERVTMPDIDIDFSDRQREDVIDYVRRKYGADHVSQIVTFGTIAARGGVRDVGRVMGVPYDQVDQIAKLIPLKDGNKPTITLDRAMELSPQLKKLYEENEQVKSLIDTAKAIEGMPRHASTHASGVVITRRPVVDYVPLAKNDESVVTQFEKDTLESLGLLKMDFLGLRNLSLLDDTVKMVRKIRPDFVLSAIPYDDPNVYQMLSEGKTSGVFQMESAGMTNVCVSLGPRSVEDLTAIIALYRPGPMRNIPQFVASKHDPSLIHYLHPLEEPILKVTYGVMVYQEQVMSVFRQLAGYSLGQADMVRRAMAKKHADEIERERNAFIYGDPTRNIEGCIAHGVPETVGVAIYNEIRDFAEYAFNKAHAVSYAVVAYQTAWFKCHYTKEYMAALLTSVLDDSGKVAEYIAECKSCGISLLPPDVNESGADFTVSGNCLRFGLAAIKGVGRGFTLEVLNERERGGPFASFPDFCSRMFGQDCNKRVVENLIKCGAFDSLGVRRSQLMAVTEQVMDSIARSRKNTLEGQYDLFGGGEESIHFAPEIAYPDLPEYSRRERMRMEKELTGLYLSGHPMDDYREQVKLCHAVPIGALLSDFTAEGGSHTYRDGQKVTLAGNVVSMKTKTTRNNSLMAYVTLEDDTGSMELLLFTRVLETSGSYLKVGEIVVVEGKISVRDEKAPQLVCDSVRPLEESATPILSVSGVEVPTGERLYIKMPSAKDPRMRKVELTLNMFPGRQQVILYCVDTKRRLGRPAFLHPALVEEMKELFGEGNVVVK